MLLSGYFPVSHGLDVLQQSLNYSSSQLGIDDVLHGIDGGILIGSKIITPGIIQYFTKKNLYMQKLEQSIVKHYFLVLLEQRQDIQVF